MDKLHFTKCALCDKEAELQLSHIIPKFVGRYLKKTSIGTIREGTNPNSAIQDIEKHYMLCHDCEELFSANERWFANNIFYPWERNKSDTFQYDKHFHYFITSLSWRSLYLDIYYHVKNNDIDVISLNKMIESEQVMKIYLLGSRPDIDTIENHVFFFDKIKQVSDQDEVDLYLNPHVNIHRLVTSYTVVSDDTIYTISNLMGIIIVTLYTKSSYEKWDGTKVENDNGIIQVKNQHIESVVNGEIQYWLQ